MALGAGSDDTSIISEQPTFPQERRRPPRERASDIASSDVKHFLMGSVCRSVIADGNADVLLA